MAISLMYVDYQRQTAGTLRSAISLIVAPLQYAIDFPFRVVRLAQSNLSSQQALITQNTSLKAQQLLLQAQLQKLLALENENANLRALLKSLPEQHQAISHIEVGQLLAVNEGSWAQEVIVDKGSRVGVYVGQPVLDATGIMGQVISTGPLTSRILLITDTRSAVPVQNSRNGTRAIATGQGASGQLALIHVPQTADIKSGDLLVTSGLGGNYLAGYPVGLVTSIKQTKGDPFMDIIVKPSAHLDRNTQVLLIWPVEKNIFIDVPLESNEQKLSAHKKIIAEAT
jgi:rod shape-determining protein MreC